MALVSKINLNGETRDIADLTARQSITQQSTTITQLQTAVAGKQTKLIAGDGIEIDDTTNVISATGGGGGGSSVTVDPALSTTSTNPVQNKVITSALQGLQSKLTAGDNIEIDANDRISAIIPTVVIDTEMSATSTNAVANYAITRELKTNSDNIANNKAAIEELQVDVLGLTDDMAAADTAIANNTAAIAVLNGDDQTTGSVKQQIAAANTTMNTKVGDLDDLTTTDKSSIVAAINEVDADIDTLNANVSTVGSVDYKINQAKLTRVKLSSDAPDAADAEFGVQYWVPQSDGTYDIYVKVTNDNDEDVMVRSGNTDVDLSDYQTKDLATSVAGEDTVEDALGALETGMTNLDASKLAHVTAMPSDPADGDVVLWVGATTADYTKGMVYQYADTDSEWKSISAANITIDDELSETSENPVQNKIITDAILGRLEKVSTMPSNPSDGDVVLFVGATTDDYTQGSIYIYDATETAWKALGGVTLTAGDGISIDDTTGAISSDVVEFHGTHDEWDALTAEEQEKYNARDFTDDVDDDDTLQAEIEELQGDVSTLNAYPKIYSVYGQILTSASAMRGNGTATVTLFANKTCRIEFSARITTAGTNASQFNCGLSSNMLKSLNSNIPTITPVKGGVLEWYNTDGIRDKDNLGYGGTLEASSGQPYWKFARMYQTSGTTGSYPETECTVGKCYIGTAYGTWA